MPNRRIITREVPAWTLDAYQSFMAGESHTYANDEKVRIYGVREIVKSEFFEYPYCRTAPHEKYYLSPEELLIDYPDINPIILDYDNKLQPHESNTQV